MVTVEGTIDVGGHAGVELAEILLQKLVSSSLGNGQTLVNVGASVAITDCPNTNTVLISGEAETLKLFNKTQGASDIP